MRSLRYAVVSVGLAVATTSGAARADNRENAARAETLFNEARRLMNAGDFAAACPKFADSQGIDPAPGTALNLALCYEKAGKMASAWAAFRAALAAARVAKQSARVKIAADHVDKLEPTLSHLTIAVAPEAQVSGLEVRCDGAPVGRPEWGSAVPWDGGGHDIEATAPDRKPWRTHVELAPTMQNLTVTVPVLDNSDVSSPPPVAPPKVSTETPPEIPSTPPVSDGKTGRILGISLGGLGLLSIGVGIYAGITAQSTYSDATKLCPGSPPSCVSGSEGFAKRDSASTWATVSTVGFVAGGAMLAAGTVLYVTARTKTTVPAVGIAPAPGGAALSLAGLF